jgi:hypothetical protein
MRNNALKVLFFFIGVIGLISSIVNLIDIPVILKIGSAIICGIGVVIGGVIYLYEISKNISLLINLRIASKWGLERIHMQGRANKIIKKKLDHIKTLRIIVVSGDNLIKSLKDELLFLLTVKRATIQLLLATPNSEFVKDVENIESDFRQNKISGEINTVISYVKEYLSEASRKEEIIGSFKIRHYNTQIRSSVIIINDEWAWLTLYLPPQRALQAMSFEFVKKNEDSIVKQCLTYFDSIWEKSKHID